MPKNTSKENNTPSVQLWLCLMYSQRNHCSACCRKGLEGSKGSEHKNRETLSKLFMQASFGNSTTTTSNRPSPFNAHCQAVPDGFKTGWISNASIKSTAWHSQCNCDEGCQMKRKVDIHFRNAQLVPFSMWICNRLFQGQPMSLLISGHCTRMHQHRVKQKGQQQERCCNM